MRLKLSCLSSNQFTIHGKTLVAEMSYLQVNVFHPLYDDACDVGFDIQSIKTGRTITVTLNGSPEDGAGDVVYWEFTPTAESIKQVPECRNVVVHIYND
jgi:hypothetical protein